MARTVKDVRLDNRAARERLESRKKPYYRVIDTRKHVGYYKGPQGGAWLARTFEGGRYKEKTLATADDTRDANGIDVLSFSQAQSSARQWFDELARERHGGHSGPYTVADACDHYLTEYIARAGKDAANMRSRIKRVKAELGSIEVAALTAIRLKTWVRSMGEAGALTRSVAIDDSTGERKRRPLDLKDADRLRSRKATANRMLTVLKAALNQAFKSPPEGVHIATRAAWEAVAPYRAVDAPKVRYLPDDEARRLLNACAPDFREIVAAALLTGCRYGELARFKVRDFDPKSNAIRVEVSKSGKGRSVALTDEGVAHFERLAKGRAGDALLLPRSNGDPWRNSNQLRRMAEACTRARISPAIGFHILRHTYGSRLAMRGAPMPVIAAQLGHSDTRMTERHYAHLAPSYVSDTIRSVLGTIGVSIADDNVVAMAGR